MCWVVGEESDVLGGGRGEWCVGWWEGKVMCLVVGGESDVLGGRRGEWCVGWWEMGVMCWVVGGGEWCVGWWKGGSDDGVTLNKNPHHQQRQL